MPSIARNAAIKSSGVGNSILKTGPGDLTFNKSSTYAGGTTISNGSLYSYVTGDAKWLPRVWKPRRGSGKIKQGKQTGKIKQGQPLIK